jgi:hypothetical protein
MRQGFAESKKSRLCGSVQFHRHNDFLRSFGEGYFPM